MQKWQRWRVKNCKRWKLTGLCPVSILKTNNNIRRTMQKKCCFSITINRSKNIINCRKKKKKFYCLYSQKYYFSFLFQLFLVFLFFFSSLLQNFNYAVSYIDGFNYNEQKRKTFAFYFTNSFFFLIITINCLLFVSESSKSPHYFTKLYVSLNIKVDKGRKKKTSKWQSFLFNSIKIVFSFTVCLKIGIKFYNI